VSYNVSAVKFYNAKNSLAFIACSPQIEAKEGVRFECTGEGVIITDVTRHLKACSAAAKLLVILVGQRWSA
jgi:hypothetical protein